MTTDRIVAQHRIAALEAQVAAYSHSHLGILSGSAIRYELAQLHTPVDLLVFDWRKLHDWNSILGWDNASVAMGQAARVDYAGLDRRHATRAIDLRGQYSGDELVLAVDVGDGLGLLRRLLRELVVLNAALTERQHAQIAAATGGTVNGFCVAAVLVEATRRPLLDAARAVDATGALKAGRMTGLRATSGARGTVLARLRP